MKTNKLIRSDFHSDVWRRLTQTLEAEIQHLRELNDVQRTEVSTASIRGQIEAMKRLLALAEASAQGSGRPEYPADQLAELNMLGIDP